jgi:dethiobiotin synthetase
VSGVLIVGTGTGVGKTHVARAICLALRRRGIAVVGAKPFETGCRPMPADALALERAARSGLPLERRCFFRYRQPLAPAAAAEIEGLKGTVAGAVARLRPLFRDHFVVVETAGGLEVPLDRTSTNLDLARRLGLPMILVGRDALGTLNHTALSVRALRAEGMEPWGVILSRGGGPADISQRSNLRWVKRMTGVRRLLSLPRGRLADSARALYSGLTLNRLVSESATAPVRGARRG